MLLSNWPFARTTNKDNNTNVMNMCRARNIRITTTTICGTDIHILKGEYPVAKGLTIGHEPVGVIEKLGSAVRGYKEGQRVIAGDVPIP